MAHYNCCMLLSIFLQNSKKYCKRRWDNHRIYEKIVKGSYLFHDFPCHCRIPYTNVPVCSCQRQSKYQICVHNIWHQWLALYVPLKWYPCAKLYFSIGSYTKDFKMNLRLVILFIITLHSWKKKTVLFYLMIHVKYGRVIMITVTDD